MTCLLDSDPATALVDCGCDNCAARLLVGTGMSLEQLREFRNMLRGGHATEPRRRHAPAAESRSSLDYERRYP